MFSSFFSKKKAQEPKATAPSIMGLRLGGSFEIDSLLMRMIEDQLTTKGAASTYIIKAVGLAELDGTWMFRFYTDDDAFLQVICEGGKADEDVVDVKLFHFYDTQDVPNQFVWDNLLNKKIGTQTYELEGLAYHRVWTSASEYHNPVYIQEKTYDDEGDTSTTDQFTMLFERDIVDGRTESLFLSAEETESESGLSRCFVISTGITLTPAQIDIHG
jgi:hypothetical protein